MVIVQGLAYVRLVRHPQPYPRGISWPALADNPDYVTKSHEETEQAFRLLAANRVLVMWSTFLRFPEAEHDDSIDVIKHVVGVLRKAIAAK